MLYITHFVMHAVGACGHTCDEVVAVWLFQGGKNAENGKKKVFVGGLPTNCTESLLKDVFSRYGNVSGTKTILVYHIHVASVHISVG